MHCLGVYKIETFSQYIYTQENIKWVYLERHRQYLLLDLYWPYYFSLFIWLGSLHRFGIINQTLALRIIMDCGNAVSQEIITQAVHRWPVVCLYIITGTLNKITDVNYYCIICFLLLFEPDHAVHTKQTYVFHVGPLSLLTLKVYCLSRIMLSTLNTKKCIPLLNPICFSHNSL